MNFNEKLTNLRRARGLSQEQLADLINVSRQAISKWETAESQPDLAKLILLTNVFEVSLDELCGRTPENTAAQPITLTKSRNRLIWMFAVTISFSLVIGVVGGIFALNYFPGADTKSEIESVSVTSFYMNPELYDNNLHLVFTPSITAAQGSDVDRYSYKVLKIDSTGKTYSYPAVFKDGVCTSDVAIDFAFGNFILNAVISDGTNDYTVVLVKVSGMNNMEYSYEELWDK
jgi:transcriptional regulator with XRE-family HTH domain